MIRTVLELVTASMSDDAKCALNEINEYLIEYTSAQQLDGEGADHQFYVTVRSLDDYEWYCVRRHLVEAGWVNPQYRSGSVSFYFPSN